MKPLRILCLSDGRPGHYNQTKGLVKAISEVRDVEVQWLEVTLKWPFLRPLLRLLLNGLRGACWWLVRPAYSLEAQAQAFDLVISTGRNTLPLNIALARRYGRKNIFIGGLKKIRPRNVDMNITIDEDGTADSVNVSMAPTFLDLLPESEQADVWMVAIGGDSGSYTYDVNDWSALLDLMQSLQAQHGIKWLLTTSRRTGAKAESFLKSGMAERGISLEATWYSEDPSPVMRDYLARSRVVLVTEDSFSMLTEVISSGRRVLALRPEQVKDDQYYNWALGRLQKTSALETIHLGQLTSAQSVFEAAHKLVPISVSSSHDLSRKIRNFIEAL